MLNNQVSPTEAQLAKLQDYPKDTPLVMLNILKFKDRINSNESGQQAYARYFKNAAPFVKKSGAKLIWKGKVFSTVIGDPENQPHIAFLVEYPTVDHVFALISDPGYQKIAGDRAISLEFGGLIACQTTD